MRRTDYSPNISVEGFNQPCKNLRLIQILDKTPPSSLETVRDRYLKERVKNQVEYFSRHSKNAQTIYKRLKAFALISTATATLVSLLAFMLSSHLGATGHASQKKHRNSPVPENNRNGLEKSSCKSVEQDENREKGPTLVVGKKSNGTSQIIRIKRRPGEAH